jgi:hypothetical protein
MRLAWEKRMEGEKRCEGTMDEKKGWTMDNDGTIPRTSKGSASWREEHAGAEKKQRGTGRKRGAR